MLKFLKKKITLFLIFIILIFFYYIVDLNFFKLQSIYFEKKWKYTKEKIFQKNSKIFEEQNNGKIFFEKDEFNFLKISLEKNGLSYRDDYIYRPIGYIDIYKDRIIFAAHDGNFYYTNKLDDLKKGITQIKKFKNSNFDFKFDINDEDPYRSILIRDILIDNDSLYVVINGRNKINEDKYSLSTSVLKGEISLDNNNITFEKFFDPKEIIVGSTDFSHSGGRIAKYKNNNFLLTVPDHALMDDYNLLIEKINSKDSIIGKILMINKKNSEIFSYGHRNPQGLFYDQINDIIFETEHGPTGGDEINLIKKDHHYGWPLATYGAHIKNLNKFREHEKNNFTEPLKFWWPRNCGMSEIIKIGNNFNKKWKGYNVLNACLSGSGANQGESIYRWEYNINKEKLYKKNQYYIGDRIRDMKYSQKNKTLLLLLEDQKSLGLIYSN